MTPPVAHGSAGVATVTRPTALSLPAKAAFVTGAALTTATLLLNVPGNPAGELRHYQPFAMLLSHAGMLLLAIGLRPALSGTLLAAAKTDPRRLTARLVAVILGVAGAMLLVGAVWPDYAHQLLTREWGVVEPLQFVLYLVAAMLCFGIAGRQRRGTSGRRLYGLGAWGALFFALEEVDHLGVLSSAARLAGVERGRIGRSHLGGLHDFFNVAAQYSVTWIPLLGVVLGVVAAVWWITGGRAAGARELVSWRLLPALIGGVFMVIAQLKDVHGLAFAERPGRRLLNDFLEEPLELLAVLCVSLTLLLELGKALDPTRAEPAPDA